MPDGVKVAAGGLGLRSAKRLRHAAHWASWADMLKALFSNSISGRQPHCCLGGWRGYT